jgi:hypothetical protein
MAVALSPIGGAGAQFFDNNGNPLSGGKLYTYEAGTTTPAATFTSLAGTTAHTNPIILDSAGRVPGGEIWLTLPDFYKFVLRTSTEVLLGTWDNIQGYSSGSVAYAATEVQIATANQTLFVLNDMFYNPSTNTLAVYVDGVNQVVNNSYVESTPTSVTFMAGLHVGAVVKFVNVNVASADASAVSYEPGFVGSVATTVQAKLRETVSVKDFGAVGDGVTDDTAAVQAAIDYCLSFQATEVNGQTLIPILEVNGMCRITSSLIITDRPEGVGNFFRIVGAGTVGGFLTTNAIKIFDSPGAITTVNQVSFEGLTFSSTNNSSYVINYLPFVRCQFDGCFFDSIRFTSLAANPSTLANYVQSLRISNSQARNVAGRFMEANYFYDVHLTNCSFEVVTGTVWYSHLGFAGCSFTDGLIQSCQNTGIETPGASESFFICGNYAEANFGEVVKIGLAAGTVFSGNYVNTRSTTPNNAANPDFFEVTIGETNGFFGGGNKFSDRGYKFTGTTFFRANVGSGDDWNDTLPLVAATNSEKLRTLGYGSLEYFGTNETGPGAQVRLSNLGTTFGTENLLSFVHGTSTKAAIRSKVFGGAGFGRMVFEGRAATAYGELANLSYLGFTLPDGISSYFLGDVFIRSGTGTPEGVVTAPVGSLFLRKDGGAGSTLYVKETGTGNTGWVAK